MKPELVEKYKYPELTDEIKANIFGKSAARLFALDPAAKRAAIEHDKFSQLRREYLQDPHPSNTQYGWVWVDESGTPPTVPIGPA
jgi:hypothetical protein